MDAEAIERCVRAFNPWPMSHFSVEDKAIKVWQSRVEEYAGNATPGNIIQADKTGIYVATGSNAIVFEQLQAPGKKAMGVQDILNSRKEWFEVGNTLN